MKRVPDRRGQPFPWQVSHLLVWYLGAGLGLTVIVAAWWGSSGTTSVTTLITWVDVGVVGVVVSGIANLLWLLEGRRAVGERRYAVLGDVDVSLHAQAPALPESEQPLVATEQMTRYHRPSCPAVAGKQVTAAARADHESAGRSRCGICQP